MDQHKLNSADFWRELELAVISKVDAALNKGEKTRAPLISYLRDLEVTARAECDRRQTVQIIASGRSMLGDQSVLGPSEDQSANDLGLSDSASGTGLDAS